MNMRKAGGRIARVLLCAGAVLAAPRARADEPHRAETEHATVILRPGADIVAFIERHADALSSNDPITYALPAQNAYLLHLRCDLDELEFVDELENGADPDVLWAEENYGADAPEGTGRNFFLNVTPSVVAYLNQPVWTQINQPAATQRSSGAGVIVAVIDTGVDRAHPALAGHLSEEGWNFLSDSDDVADVGDGIDNDDDHFVDEMTGHGTHVAGIIAAIAPDAVILPIKALDSDGSGDNFVVAMAIYYAIDHNASVINMSLGSTAQSRVVEDAVDAAYAAGIVLVAAAGNHGNVSGGNPNPHYYPGYYHNVVQVAALNPDGSKWPLSSFNSRVIISAPGTGIYGPVPGSLYAQWDGTSAATPLVSGTVAAILARHPEWPAEEHRVECVVRAITDTAINIDAENDGTPWIDKIGAGMVDAGAAVHLDCVAGCGPCLGDANCDGTLNLLDIEPFLTALADSGSWYDANYGCDIRTADMNLDGSVNPFDIQPFIHALLD